MKKYTKEQNQILFTDFFNHIDTLVASDNTKNVFKKLYLQNEYYFILEMVTYNVNDELLMKYMMLDNEEEENNYRDQLYNSYKNIRNILQFMKLDNLTTAMDLINLYEKIDQNILNNIIKLIFN